MKKIGILFGQERSFPMAFIDRVNSKAIEGITAELVDFVPGDFFPSKSQNY